MEGTGLHFATERPGGGVQEAPVAVRALELTLSPMLSWESLDRVWGPRNFWKFYSLSDSLSFGNVYVHLQETV